MKNYNQKSKTILIFLIIFFGILVFAKSSEAQVTQWGVFEKTLTTTNSYTDTQKYSSVVLSATFTGPGGVKYTVPGFWDGGNTWRIRFAPTAPGTWTYTIESTDSQLNNPANDGSFSSVAPTSAEIADNSNLHGLLKVNADGRGFTYVDGTPFFWMADTNWAANGRDTGYDTDATDPPDHQVPEFRTWIDNRKTKKFSVVQFVVQNSNEGGDTFTALPTLINPSNFQWLDKRVKYVTDAGMVPVLFGLTWSSPQGLYYDTWSLTDLKNYWRYLVARYQVYNVIWSLNVEYGYTTNIQKFRDIGNYIKTIDQLGHLITIHPGPDNRITNTSSRDFQNDAWLDFNMQQTWGSSERSVAVNDYGLGPVKPFVNGEFGYDGLWGMDRTSTRRQAWIVYMSGGAGVSYGIHGIWYWNDGSIDSYLQATYGSSARWWDVIDSSSSFDMKRIVDFFASREWWKLSRHDELVTSGYALAEPGRQYVVWWSGSFSTTISGLPVEISASWFNPRDGSYQSAGNGPTFTSPTNDDWVLSISSIGSVDTQAPTIPTNLIATPVSSSQINLSWTASTDNVGVAGYRIYRGGNQIATTQSISYQDTGLSPSTVYTYTVSAYDAAGNVSGHSSSASATTPAASQNPIAWWKLDETSGTTASDSSGNGNTGILINSPTWTTGKIGGALSFDGVNDYVQIPEASSLKPTGGVSFGAWFKTAGYDNNFIVERQKNSWVSYAMHLSGDGTSARVRCIIGYDSGVNTYTVTSVTTIGNNTWHHAICVYDKQNLKVFVDGVESGSIQGTNSIYYDGSVGPRIGFHYEANTHFNGLIDDVRIYDRALSASEVQALYNAGTTKKGDLNNDGKVDVIDLGIFLSNWGKTTRPPADLNQDGRVDVTDLGIFLSNWG